MKKKIVSLALVLALCLSLLPVTAFAEEGAEVPVEEPIRTSINTVEDLMQFAAEATEGKYDGKEDAVVSLNADLDLTGKNWVPIAGRPIGDEIPCFSGTFYGNNHVISGLDLSSVYNEQQYFAGFFGALWKAKVYDLTVKGIFDATESDDSFRGSLGSIAGFADSSVISNCVSEVSFNNNGKILAGMIGMVGNVNNTLVEYCENKGEFTFTNDMGSSYIGGIVGCADDTSEIKYCANTAPMTLLATNSGAIAGAITGQSKIDNCYATGKLTVLGTASQNNVSGMVGTIYTGTTISNSYFAGEFDLSKYGVQLTPEKPAYMHLGGIAGQIGKSSDTELAEPQFANDYYTETKNIFACGRDTEARAGVSTKLADYMKTKDFYDEITKAGGNYRYEEGSTPLLPKLTHEVSFVITPENMTDIVVTVDGQEAANPIALENGKHTFTVTAKNCDPFSGEFTVSANPETHTQTVAMTYLPADYAAVDAAIKKANALNESDYKNFDTVKSAIAAVVRGKNITQQADVDAMAKAINDAMEGLEEKSTSSGGHSSSSSGNTTTKTETTTNPDGSTTKTETKADGSVTETTTGTDGSTTKTETKTETKSDGTKTETKTETKTDADGNKTTSKTETTTDKSGNVTETVKETLPNGSTGTTTTTTDASGAKTEAETTISSKAVDEAKKNDTAVTVPVDVKATEDSQTAPTVKVELPKNSGETKVEIPVSNVTPGTVVAVVKPDGTEEIVKDCIPTENGIQLAVEDNVTLKVFDNAKDFTDTKGHWAEPYIDFASARELLNGISEDTFAPEQPTTRAMMWTVLARQDDTDLSGGTTWYDKAQAWAKDSGVSDGTAPQANVTRAQMVTMLWRAAGSPAPQTMSSFADVSADAYYAAAVAWAAEQGITNGVSATQFQPNGACTRAQIAAFLYRASLEN